MIVLTTWPVNAAEVLGQAIEPQHLDAIRDEVQAGICQVWHCKDGQQQAWIVTRVLPQEKIWLCLAYQGVAIHKFLPPFVVAARDRGLRITYRPGSRFTDRLLKRFARLGWIEKDQQVRYGC